MTEVRPPRHERGHHEHEHPEHRDRRLDDELARWIAASVITAEQAAAIRDLEDRRAAVRPARIPLVAEALGFLGGALAAVAGVITVSRFWDDLATAARLGLVTTVGVLLVAAGWVVRRGGEPALDHLGSFLWVLATGCAAFVAGIAAVDVLDLDGADAALAVGAATAAAGAALWAWRPAPLQHVATLVGVAVAASALAGQVQHVGGRLVGVALWAVGAGWAVLAWSGRIRPEPLGYALGGVLTIVGGRVLGGDAGGFGEDALAIATAGAFLAASVPAGSLALLWAGVAGVFVSVPVAVGRHLGGSGLAPLVLFVAGMALIGTAVLASRLVDRVKEGRERPPRVSDRAVERGLLAAVAAVVALVVVLTPFQDVPAFPSLAAAPDPAVDGTVAYVRVGDGRSCIVLADAGGGGAARDLRCADDLGGAALAWNAAGNVVAETWQESGPRTEEIDRATGEVVSTTTSAEFGKAYEPGRAVRHSDGAELAFDSTGPGDARLTVRPPSGEPRTVVEVDGPVDYGFRDASWSPDGRYALVLDSEDRLLVVDVASDRPSPRVLATDAVAAAWGP